MNDDFYVGYLPQAPDGLARFVRRVIVGLFLLVLATALLLVLAQGKYAASAFEFGNPHEFSGVIEAHPYPTLVVARPYSGGTEVASRYLLVAPGKHGADDLVAGFDGKDVKLRGTLIYRDGETMVEVVPGSISGAGNAVAAAEAVVVLGTVTLRGEIVDSKCYLGVMNPGNGKVHRDCAVRCISGGAPPLFVGADKGDIFVLTATDGGVIAHDQLRPFIAEPITLHGLLEQHGSQLYLRIDPGKLQHTLDRVESVWACSRSR
jgi:hypothetical protein